jgi:hypothetical protein
MTRRLFVRPRLRGVTLLETVIYIALLSAILTGIVVSVYPLFSGLERTGSKVLAESEAAFALRKVAWVLSDATAIAAPAAGASGSALTVTGPGGTVSIAQSGTTLAQGGTPLLSSRVAVSNVLVRHVAPSGATPRLIEVEFDIGGRHVGPWRKYVSF